VKAAPDLVRVQFHVVRLEQAPAQAFAAAAEAVGSVRRAIRARDVPDAGKPWSRQAVHQAERGQRSFTAAELTALALVLDTSVQALFRAESEQVELPGRAVAPEEYRGILLNRQNDAPLDGLEELIVALHDIGEVLQRPSLARLVRIARAAEQVTEPPQPPTARRQRP
jgi:hypothetical protein